LKHLNLPINIPNILTVSRILLIPVFVIFLLKDLMTFALLTVIYAAVSDGLDGLLARYFKQQSALGSYLDPIADKLLLTSAYISLAVLKYIPGWLTVLVISRDVFIVLAFAIFVLFDIKVDAKPSLISKWTTVAQLTTIMVTLLSLEFPITFALIIKPPLYWIVAILTILSGFHYVYVGLNILQEASNTRGKK
jgi:cardiolipin synthase